MRACLVALCMATLSAMPAYALEGLTDESLADATGQAGITFVTSAIAMSAADMFYHDTDSVVIDGATYSSARLNLKNFNQSVTNFTLGLDAATGAYASATRSGLFLRLNFSDLDASFSPQLENAAAPATNPRSFGSFALNNLALTNGDFLILPKGDGGNSGLTLAVASVNSLSGTVSFADATSVATDFTMSNLDFSGTTIDIAPSGATDGAGLKVKLASGLPETFGMTADVKIGGTSAGSFKLSNFRLANTELTLRGK